MTEVSPLRAQNPADRTEARPPGDNRTRTVVSVPFSHLLHAPSQGNISALGPTGPSPRLNASQTHGDGAVHPPDPRARRGQESPPDTQASEHPQATVEIALDPLFCQLAMNSGFTSFVQHDSAPLATPAALPIREDLQNLLTGLARRSAWGGDRRKGSARIELGEGALAGATLVVHTDQRNVSVDLELPPGTAAQGWQRRISERLEARGFAARVTVG